MQPRRYTLDPTRSRIGFRAKAGLLPRYGSGRFETAEGELSCGVALEDTVARGSIQVASLYSRVHARDAELLGPHLLNAREYPVIHYVSTAIEAVSENRYRVTGDLSIKEATKPVVLEVEVAGAADEQIRLHARGAINRLDFGVQRGPDDRAGMAERIELHLDLVALESSRPAPRVSDPGPA